MQQQNMMQDPQFQHGGQLNQPVFSDQQGMLHPNNQFSAELLQNGMALDRSQGTLPQIDDDSQAFLSAYEQFERLLDEMDSGSTSSAVTQSSALTNTAASAGNPPHSFDQSYQCYQGIEAHTEQPEKQTDQPSQPYLSPEDAVSLYTFLDG